MNDDEMAFAEYARRYGSPAQKWFAGVSKLQVQMTKVTLPGPDDRLPKLPSEMDWLPKPDEAKYKQFFPCCSYILYVYPRPNKEYTEFVFQWHDEELKKKFRWIYCLRWKTIDFFAEAKPKENEGEIIGALLENMFEEFAEETLMEPY